MPMIPERKEIPLEDDIRKKVYEFIIQRGAPKPEKIDYVGSLQWDYGEHYPIELCTVDLESPPSLMQGKYLSHGVQTLIWYLDACGFKPVWPRADIAVFHNRYAEKSQKHKTISAGTVAWHKGKYLAVAVGEMDQLTIGTIVHELGHALVLDKIAEEVRGERKIYRGSNQIHPFLDEGVLTMLKSFLIETFARIKDLNTPCEIIGKDFFLPDVSSLYRTLFSKWDMSIAAPIEEMQNRGFSSQYLGYMKGIIACAREESPLDLDSIAQKINYRKGMGRKKNSIIRDFQTQDQSIKLNYTLGAAIVYALAQRTNTFEWIKSAMREVQKIYIQRGNRTNAIPLTRIMEDIVGEDPQEATQQACQCLVDAAKFGAKMCGMDEPETFLDRFVAQYEEMCERQERGEKVQIKEGGAFFRRETIQKCLSQVIE